MTTDDIIAAIQRTEPAFDLDQTRQILKEHEAWISIDLLITEVNEVVSTTSIHFQFPN